MNVSNRTVVLVCLALAAAATIVDLILEVSGNSAFDPQPLYVFLALILGQQGAKASSEKKESKRDNRKP